jgi:hypothetical protein
MQGKPPIGLLIALLLGIGVLGCHPNLKAEKIDWVSRTLIDLIHDGKTPFTQDQVERLLGPPDVVTSVSDFPGLLRGVARGKDVEKTVQDNMECIYRGYLWGLEQLGMEHTRTLRRWEYDKRFLQCRLLLYAWVEPRRTYVCGLIPKRTNIMSSDYFLVLGDRVIDPGGVLWVRP